MATPRVVTTLAGNGSNNPVVDGMGTNATFYYPTGVVPDSSGNLFVVGYWDNRIRKISPNGAVVTFAGNGTAAYADGTGTNARFKSPHGITIDPAGNLYVADEGNSLIREITPAGVVTTFAGTGTAGFADGLPSQAVFSGPRGLALDAWASLFVADEGNHRIRAIK